VIDNRAGGSSIIGTQIIARAAPDGQTIGMIDAAFVVNPSLIGKLPYDTVKDFTPIVLVATAPLVLCVHPAVPAKSVRELVALAKAQPGKLSFGSAVMARPCIWQASSCARRPHRHPAHTV
jgi:tripartite-type tricarboxylate transporter receptor subunit TctC